MGVTSKLRVILSLVIRRSSALGAVAAAAIALVAVLGGRAAQAQAWWTATENAHPVPSIASSLPHNGDPAGIRKWLGDRGVIYGLEYTNDVLSNVKGGNRVGTIDQGKLHGILTIDFGKLAGLQGLTLFSNFFQIHNTGRMRRDYVGGINTIAAIEAVPTIRLSEIWLEQKFAGDKAAFKIGQIAADTEFFFSDASVIFLATDWPTISASNLPSGGAAYPLSTPGVRLKVEPNNNVALLFEVLNGDPAGPGAGDEQDRNRYGLNFRVRDPAFIIGEAQFRLNHEPTDRGLATVLKLGGWGHLGQFDDKRLASDGSLLANPLSPGTPLQHRGNVGLYAVIDQQLWRPAGGAVNSGITVYSRMSMSPSDRNLINAYIDGGVVFGSLIPGRPDDKFGFNAMYARFSDAVRAFDRDTIAFTGLPGVIRDYEANLELNYTAQIVPGLYVQPLVTRVWHPSGDSSKNALVMGVRSLWRY